MSISKEGSIVFFDGVCNLCNATVDFLIRVDQRKRLKFASLQGQTAKRVLGIDQTIDPESIIYQSDGRIYHQSSAVFRIMKDIGGIWTLLYAFIVVPRPLRDAVYKWVARNRYRWFGRKDTCRLPTEEEKDLFLD